ncbi:free fatty acid receptor 4 isoform X2 [Erinaceus europaeus]|uniref:Free fatty acid receptor 4 isoform X2 n=1 Tax=Erinaceus europaeus TaxID=9365 RepID=A0ABM3XGY5_ERIEU|nr:free fatty acid receptor 4 isoform X2 [Erinaceus europaeus]
MFLERTQPAAPGPQRSLERLNRTRFPFFSDSKGDHRLVLTAVETAVLALIFMVSLLGNVCALVLVARRRRRGTTACLVLNLFCADLLFTGAIPPVLAVRWTEAWLLGSAACHLLFYVMSLSGSVTILTLAAVSLERMVCIVRLQRGVRGPGWRARAALLALIWGYSALTALPLCVFFQVIPQRLPGAQQITKASRRRLTVNMAYSDNHQIRVSQQDFRLFRTLFLLMISFFIMWSPIIITILLILIQNFKQDLVIWPSLFFWVMAFTFSNSALNPILYNMSLFRNEWRKIFHCFLFSEKGAMFTDTSVRRNDLSIISN